MLRTPTLPCLLALAGVLVPTAPAGDLLLRVRGVVTSAGPAVTAPFQLDPVFQNQVELVFDLLEPATISPPFAEYATDPRSSGFTSDHFGDTLTVGTAQPACFVANDSPALGDVLSLFGTLARSGHSVSVQIAAPAADLFTSADLRTQLGTRAVPAGSSLSFTITDPATGAVTVDVVPLQITIQDSPGTLGVSFCEVQPNSTGRQGLLQATGSLVLSDDDLTLTASLLPPQEFGYVISSRVQNGWIPCPGLCPVLCIWSPIGRHLNTIASSGAAGTIVASIPLPTFPAPSGTTQVLSGESWTFQLWHRDPVVHTEMTRALVVQFQ